jgi:hypothetical protein
VKGSAGGPMLAILLHPLPLQNIGRTRAAGSTGAKVACSWEVMDLRQTSSWSKGGAEPPQMLGEIMSLSQGTEESRQGRGHS